MRFRTRSLASAAALALCFGGAASGQSGPTPVMGGPSSFRASGEQPARRVIPITAGKSATIDFDRDLRIGGTTNPKVADVRMVTPRHAAILGMGYGQTDAQFYDASGRLVLVVDVRVEQDMKAIEDTMRRIIPSAQITTQAVNDSIILTGLVQNAAEADKAVQIAGLFAGKPEQVRNLLTIAGKDQVTLKVQVVEVNRSVVKQLGFDTNFLMGQLGGPQYLLGNSPSYAVNGGFQGGLGAGYTVDTTKQPILNEDVYIQAPDGSYSLRTYPRVRPDSLISTPQNSIGSNGLNQGRALIQAFERQGLVRTLAEPNLTAVSGESAKFLAGGEYPVPSGRDQNGNVIVEFKPYGVGLGFTPVVLSAGRISLKISTEVSELTTQGALTLAGGAGQAAIVVPALTVRRVENTIELPSGGSMMIAGLLQEQTRQNIDKVPGIDNVPILGVLARSRDFLNNETELVIIVTAYLTGSTSPDKMQTPADGLRIASDAETILLGKLNTAYKAPAGATEERTYQGPFGHVIE